MKGIRCPFFNVDNEYGTIFCDNLVSGIPSCVSANFYCSVLRLLSVETIGTYNEWYTRFNVCSHFVVGESPSKLVFGVCCDACAYKSTFIRCSSKCFARCEGSEATVATV